MTSQYYFLFTIMYLHTLVHFQVAVSEWRDQNAIVDKLKLKREVNQKITFAGQG